MRFFGIMFVGASMVCLNDALPRFDATDNRLTLNDAEVYSGDNRTQTQIPGSREGTEEQLTSDGQNRPPRFGFPTYVQDIQATGNALPGLYGPVKLDIGGLVLGTIVGLGAFFILPKLFHVAATPYSGYKRSEEEPNDGNALSEFIGKFQESLNAVDSSACLQRAICSSVQTVHEKVGNNTANEFENVFDNIAGSDLFQALITGTDWKMAMEAGQKGENCAVTFNKCSDEIDAVVSSITKYLLS